MKAQFLAGGLLLIIVWAALVGVIVAARQVREIEPGPATMDLGDEPPAVAALLANGFMLPSEAAPATILDLAARGVIKIEDYRPGLPMIRLTGVAGGLRPYEERVMDLLESRASGGVVPAEALSSGEGEVSTKWRRNFRNEVIDEAQERDLTKNLWDARLTAIFSAAAVLPAGLMLFAFNWQVGAVTWFLMTSALRVVAFARLQRPTPKGLHRAAFWLGVREHLGTQGEFSDVGPSGVAIWERYLAYAVAFEIAEHAAAQLPLGDEDDRNAWSPWGGRWRPVTVSYPVRYPPMWGMHPALALALSLGICMAGAVLLFVGSKVSGARVPIPDSAAGGVRTTGLIVMFIGLVVGATGLLTGIRALIDLTASREVSGYLVRKRARTGFLDTSKDKKYRYYLAVDDGSNPKIKAWRVPEATFGRVEQGVNVTAVVTRHLGYVKSIQSVS